MNALLLSFSLVLRSSPVLAADGGVDATMLAPTPDLLVDPAFDVATRERLPTVAADALERISLVLGPRRGPVPLFIFCKGEESACALAFAGTGRVSKSLAPGRKADGASYVPTRHALVVLIEPSTDVLAFTTHEATHVEFFHRLGGVAVPHWFAEGVAVHISRQVCEAGSRGIDDLKRLHMGADWGRFTSMSAGARIYCQAGLEVGARLARVTDGGVSGLTEVIDALAAGRPFDEVYGPLANGSTRTTPVFSHGNEAGWRELPFTIAAFVRPTANRGVLAWLSSSLSGTGACTPLMGFTPQGELVGHWYLGGTPTAFASVRTAGLPLKRWSHVALTRSPAELTLFIDGKPVGAAPATTGVDHGGRSQPIVTWGSPNVSGAGACFTGLVEETPFPGLMTGMAVTGRALSAAEVAALAAAPGLIETRRRGR